MTIYFPRTFSAKLSTKRASGTGTRRGPPVPKLSDVRCSEVIPFDQESRRETSVDLTGLSVDFQVFCDPADISREDRVTLDGDTVEYVVVGVMAYPVTNPKAMHVLLRRYQGT